MQANHDKYHLLMTIDTSVSVNINVFNIQVTGTKNNYLVPNSIVNSFENHVSNPYKKVSQTLRVLIRIVNYMDFSKRKVVIKIFVISQFNNCQLFQMFHSRKLNNHISSIYEKILRVTYQDYKSTFLEPSLKITL